LATGITRLVEENAELIVEKHTVSNITIKEHEETAAVEATVRTEAATAPIWINRFALRRRQLLIAVAALLVVVALAAIWLVMRSKSAPSRLAIRSIAVLPLKPLSAEAKDEYLGPSLADALVTRLSGLRQIAVRPSSATLKYDQ